MKTFLYRGYDKSGVRARGMVEALHAKDAREKLAARGILTEDLATSSARAAADRGRFTAEKRAALYREIGALLRAGVPVVAALDLLMDAHPDSRAGRILAGLRDRVREGESFAVAMPGVMPEISTFEVALLQGGQRTGKLGEMLDQMASYLEEETRLRSGILSALLYPLLVVALALVVGIIMITAILPRLAGLFAESGVALPATTKILIWFGGAGRVPAILALVAFALAVFGVFYRFKRSARRAHWERHFRRLPLIGQGYRLVVTIRFVRTLVMLLRGGVALVDALPLAARATGSDWLAAEMQRGSESVRQGRSVPEVLAESPWIGNSLPAWYRAGEASGDLTGLLDQAARRYQEQWETLLQRFIRLVEPILIIAVGVVVLIVALAILQPILSLNQLAR